ncbi:hypothetical protein [Brachybacterium phenoliresistens]|uniref:hypothetical protein n=1 Tax=Brachybacterium phenoliresistens TaxID=396014 RepID=UPI0031D271A1
MTEIYAMPPDAMGGGAGFVLADPRVALRGGAPVDGRLYSIQYGEPSVLDEEVVVMVGTVLRSYPAMILPPESKRRTAPEGFAVFEDGRSVPLDQVRNDRTACVQGGVGSVPE